MAPPGTKKGIGESYDKVILLVCLVLMGLMVGYVALQIMNPPDPADTQATSKKKPEPFDSAAYAVQPVPSIDSSNTNLVLVSEERVSCINPECGKPILEKVHKECPYCGFRQPDETLADRDNDTILDHHEKLAGLDPTDPTDCILDSDGDLVVNWREYKAGKDQGDPLKYKMNDPTSHPPYAEYLRGFGFTNDPQEFYFAGMSKLAGNKFSFQLQVRNRDRTYFKKMGEVVDKTGYRIIKYQGPEGEFTPTESKPKPPVPIVPGKPPEPSYLTIQEIGAAGSPPGEPITLTKGVVTNKNDRAAKIIFMLDPKVRILGKAKKGVKAGERFTVMGEDYEVISVKRSQVVVQNVKDGTNWPINPVTAEDKVKLDQVMKGTWKEPMPNEETGFEFEGRGELDGRGGPSRVPSRTGFRPGNEEELYRRARGLPPSGAVPRRP